MSGGRKFYPGAASQTATPDFMQQFIEATSLDQIEAIQQAIMEEVEKRNKTNGSSVEQKESASPSPSASNFQIAMPVAVVTLSGNVNNKFREGLLFGNDLVAQDLFLQSAGGNKPVPSSSTISGMFMANSQVNKVNCKIYYDADKNNFQEIDKSDLQAINFVLLFGNDVERLNASIAILAKEAGFKGAHLLAYDRKAQTVHRIECGEDIQNLSNTLKNLMVLNQIPMTVANGSAVKVSKMLLQEILQGEGPKEDKRCNIM